MKNPELWFNRGKKDIFNQMRETLNIINNMWLIT